MTVTAWSEMKHYDPTLGDDAICVIGYTGRGAFWIRERLTPPGRLRREQRQKLLDRITQAVTTGQQPGEVHLNGEEPLDVDQSSRGEDQGVW